MRVQRVPLTAGRPARTTRSSDDRDQGLRKSFRSRAGSRDEDGRGRAGRRPEVAEGEIFGFLGPNGAGKTTTLRMLATLIEPDGGEATIAGADLRKRPGRGAPPHRLRRRRAAAPGTSRTAREELVLQARMYGIGKADAQRRAAAALDAFQLTEYADRKCKTYSGGQRRRVDIALGIIHEPKVVFLDEPTTGLDPQSRAHMWDEIRRLRAEGMTVFITTHYLDEADALCDRIAIMDHGEIVAEGTPDELKREISGDVVHRRPRPADTAQAAELLDGAAVRPQAGDADEGGLRLYVDDGATAIPQILRALDAAGHRAAARSSCTGPASTTCS